MNDSAKASHPGFPYVFILAALNLIDAHRIPNEAKTFVYKHQFCAKYLTPTQLARINEALAALSDDEFLSFVIANQQQAKRLADLQPCLQRWPSNGRLVNDISGADNARRCCNCDERLT